MNTITIEHLVPYLPYKLKAEILDYKYDYVGNQYDLIIGVHQWDRSGELWSCITNGGAKPSPSRVKPILRPLSDLVKEIEHNGERFVPMIKLADDFYKPRKHDMFGNIATCRNGLLWFDSSSKRFLYSDGGNTECPLRIFEMYQKVFAWHFDVFGLIPKGLAIDINTLEK